MKETLRFEKNYCQVREQSITSCTWKRIKKVVREISIIVHLEEVQEGPTCMYIDLSRISFALFPSKAVTWEKTMVSLGPQKPSMLIL